MKKRNRQEENKPARRAAMIPLVLLGAVLTYATDVSAAGAPQTELTGTFSVTYGDPVCEGGGEPRHAYHLRDDRGVAHPLDFTPEASARTGGLNRFDRRRVRVKGRRSVVQFGERFVVEDISSTGVPAADGGIIAASDTIGSQPYVWILCRFADRPNTPEPVAWFETQAVSGYPSMDHFWREVSFNNINLIGSEVYGWYDLPHNHSYYVYDDDGDGTLDPHLDLILDDALAVSDPDIYFPDFIGMNIIVNDVVDDCCAWGGRPALTLDGVNRSWGVTWMPPMGWRTHGYLAHEMGHALGLPHCSGPYAGTYDSQWGLMSHSYGTAAVSDPVYGRLGVHAISYHKDQLGWIPSWARYETPSSPDVQTVDLFHLAVYPPSGTFQMVKLPLYSTDASEFYTVERRKLTGYDLNVPGDAVVLHHVDPDRDKPANVVDPDGDGDCNDDGAMFLPGETFYDQDNNIAVSVLWADSDSSIVTFTNNAFSPVYANAANSGFENGTPVYPYNTVEEAHAAVQPNGTIYANAGTYLQPTDRLLCRPVTIRRNGTSGVVTIEAAP